MNEKLKVAAELSLPLDAVTQTMAAIARKGAGKTYLASMIAEQMLDARAQVIVVDPVGNWWGLRVAADGKAKGKDIFIIGGDHGDVPLVPEAGARVLGGSEGRLLRAAAEFYPQHVTKEVLSAQTGFSSSGGGFNNYLGHMRTLGFITYPQKGCVRAADWLFVEGSR